MSKPDGGPAIGYLSLRGGEISLISPEDFYLVAFSGWVLGRNGYVYKAGGRTKGKQVLLHRIIMDAKPGEEIHHLNGDKLNNQRSNLERIDASNHQRNHHSHLIIKRNLESRKYPTHRICLNCAKEFLVNPNHRGRNRFCTKLCGNQYPNRRKHKNA